MSEPLIQALENRIEHGETKEELRQEVLSAGHSEDIFEAAYREAAVRVAEREAEQAAEEEVVSPTLTTSRPRTAGPEHTLRVGKPVIIGVSEMLQQGWEVAKQNAGYLGSAIVAIIIGALAVIVVAAVVGGASLGFADSENGTAVAFAVLFVLLYFVALLLGMMVRFVLTRSLLQRRLGHSFWSQLHWGFLSLNSIFVLLLFTQLLTFTGTIFLIIPGVIAWVYFSQSVLVFAGEDKRGLDALVRSCELVYGHFWQVLGRYAAVIGTILVASVVVSLLIPEDSILVALSAAIQIGLSYWALCCSVVLFESLQHMYPGKRFAAETVATLKRWFKIGATIAVLLIMLAFAGVINFLLNADDVYEDLIEASMPVAPELPEINLPDVSEKQEARSAAVKQNLGTIRSQAELYWSENLSYAGVCSEPLGAYDLISRTYELGVGDVHCADDKDWYLVEAELPDGSYYCIDGSANAQVVPESRKGQQTCF